LFWRCPQLGLASHAACTGCRPMAVCAPHARPPESFEGFASRADSPVSIRRRSSVVERVIGNDEVLSSILSGGTIQFRALHQRPRTTGIAEVCRQGKVPGLKPLRRGKTLRVRRNPSREKY
jgi:hypothetical protein